MDTSLDATAASSPSPLVNSNARSVASFFLGWVFLQSAHYMLEILIPRIASCLSRRRTRSDLEGEPYFGEKSASAPSLAAHDQLSTPNALNWTTFALYPCFLFASLLSTASLMTFGPNKSIACGALIAMFAVALQAARVVAYASIILDLRRSVSLPPWELLTIITVIVVGFGFFVATEAIAPGVLLQLSTRDAYVCVDQHYAPSSSVCTVVYILLNVYFVTRGCFSSLRSRSVSGNTVALRAGSLLLLEIFIMVPNAMPTGTLGNTIPFSFGAIIVQAVFHYTRLRLAAAITASQSPERPASLAPPSVTSSLPRLIFSRPNTRPNTFISQASGDRGPSPIDSRKSTPFSLRLFPQPPLVQPAESPKTPHLRSKRKFSSESSPATLRPPEPSSPTPFSPASSSFDSAQLHSVENAVLTTAQKGAVVTSASLAVPSSASSGDLLRSALRNSLTFRVESEPVAGSSLGQPIIPHPFAYPTAIQATRTPEDGQPPASASRSSRPKEHRPKDKGKHRQRRSLTPPLESFWDDSQDRLSALSPRPASKSPPLVTIPSYSANVSVVSPTTADEESEAESGSPLSAVYGSDIIRLDDARDLTKSDHHTRKHTLTSSEGNALEAGSRRASSTRTTESALRDSNSRSSKLNRWPTLRTFGSHGERWSATTYSTQTTHSSSRSGGSMAGRLTRTSRSDALDTVHT
ncbi:hypothetical protein EV714DRAFT_245405 [Schizophyllum commune]